MSLKGCNEQIEHLEYWYPPKDKWKKTSHSRKYYKKVRNRLIRRVKVTEIPNIKYNGYEY